MKQYNSIKRKYPDALLLFRVGDFYETFGEDAIRASKVLDIVLTKRGAGSTSETALAGFPHHALNTYLPKLVKAGFRVAICDQLEDPKTTKTIVKRGVTELITPGVSLNDEVLHSKSNNFLCAVHAEKGQYGLAFLDISTGEFLTTQGDKQLTDKLLQSFSPSEILIAKPLKSEFFENFGKDYHTFFLEDWAFQWDFGYGLLTRHFGTQTLKGFGVENLELGIVASGAVLHYLSETQHHKLQHVSAIHRIAEESFVWMDRFTIRNLELFQCANPGGVSLLDIIDHTITPMGGRLIKRWMALPLKDLNKIERRQQIVSHWTQNTLQLDEVRRQLKLVGDLERLLSKTATGKISPREVYQLYRSLDALIPIKKLCLTANAKVIQALGEKIHDFELLRRQIKKTLQAEAPVNILKGNAIATGVSEELDTLRNLAHTSKKYLDDLADREARTTGISSLKIASNNVFGYYIEVRNTHKEKVPPEWIRKQTLVNAERYITEELKEFEAKILGAEEKITLLEQQIFQELVAEIQEYITSIQLNATLAAELDCLCNFAHIALQHRYVKPQLNEGFEIHFKQARHPVIEHQLPAGESYIANDLVLNKETQQMVMITGPNMSGKSAILRQTALIVILAQMGSFIPADAAEMGLVDKIFTRVGASDNISSGESTFMVEMNETSSILNNLSERSLILLDEIGRGTSTYDGISIAWAIAVYLHEHHYRPKTLFATHYHELNEMTTHFDRIKNYNVSVKELKDKVLFLRKLVPGGSAHSFGIHVAKMAGMPKTVIDTANKLLQKLEASHAGDQISEKVKGAGTENMQLSFFQLDDPLLEELRDELLGIEIDSLTPIEALMKLNEIKRMLQRQTKSNLKKQGG
ncbi:MAG: DNA mismatch repair protein MutS [Flavobacteriaceae bacterium]|nr:DNA mismatch repair protein MutS [Flavobacteriaceae bacterium]